MNKSLYIHTIKNADVFKYQKQSKNQKYFNEIIWHKYQDIVDKLVQKIRLSAITC